jgi:predicted DNA-binding transcriptional regulator YafY
MQRRDVLGDGLADLVWLSDGRREMSKEREVVIDYTNWRGERAHRRIIPLGVSFTSNEWHPTPQWLLLAIDVEKDAERTFAMCSIHAFGKG